MARCAVQGGIIDCRPLGDGRCAVEGNVIPCRIMTKCAVEGGEIDCLPLGNGKCQVEGGVVSCPPPESGYTIMTTCITRGSNVCVPVNVIYSESNAKKFATIKDTNADGLICVDEVDSWVSDKYDELWANAIFPVCEGFLTFSGKNALSALRNTRGEIRSLIGDVAYDVFAGCSENNRVAVLNRLDASFAATEKGLINYTIPAAVDQGDGQLGFSWEASSGKITSLREDSDGARGGLMLGDKIISVDGFLYSNTVDYQISQPWSSLLYLSPWFSYPESKSYKDMQKVGTSANSLFFGPCGSVAEVVVERDGKTLPPMHITRGRG